MLGIHIRISIKCTLELLLVRLNSICIVSLNAISLFFFPDKPKEEKKDTFLEKLATQVIKNVQVKITGIHVKYEDDVSTWNMLSPFYI